MLAGNRLLTSCSTAHYRRPSNPRFGGHGCCFARAPARSINEERAKKSGRFALSRVAFNQKDHEVDARARTVEKPKPVPPMNWYKQWYPVRVVRDLEPSVPHAVQLLGMNLVVWCDADGTWRCFRDCCPHRLAPLSEGRIEPTTGNLFCNYHGWQFDKSGTCASIPALPGKTSPPRACCVESFPTKVAEQLLWVWADASPQALAEAAEAPWKGVAPWVDEFGDAAFAWDMAGWFFRDLPLPWLYLRENSGNDPAHDQVLHHGVRGLSRDDAGCWPTYRHYFNQEGWSIRVDFEGTSFSMTDTMVMPVGFRRTPHIGGNTVNEEMVGYVVPSAPGRSLIFGARVQHPGDKRDMSTALQRWMKPVWLQHIQQQHDIAVADLVMIAGVAANRVNSFKQPHLPSQLDEGVRSLVLWLKTYGAGGPPSGPLSDPFGGAPCGVSQEELLDHFHQHTQHCSSCRMAYRNASIICDTVKWVQISLVTAALVTLPMSGTAAAVYATLAVIAHGVVAASAWTKARLQSVPFDEHHVSKK